MLGKWMLTARSFSRVDILKGLDKSKISRKAFIRKELTENPEFFKAYPHLQGLLNADKEEEGLGKAERREPEYFEDSTVGFKEDKADFFGSLLHHHN